MSELDSVWLPDCMAAGSVCAHASNAPYVPLYAPYTLCALYALYCLYTLCAPRSACAGVWCVWLDQLFSAAILQQSVTPGLPGRPGEDRSRL